MMKNVRPDQRDMDVPLDMRLADFDGYITVIKNLNELVAQYRLDKIERELWLYGIGSAIHYDGDMDCYRRDGMMFEE